MFIKTQQWSIVAFLWCDLFAAWVNVFILNWVIDILVEYQKLIWHTIPVQMT